MSILLESGSHASLHNACYEYQVGLWLLSTMVRQRVASRRDDSTVEQRHYNAVMH